MVACDTQNPPREISSQHPIFDVVQRHLPDKFDAWLDDHGQGAVTLLVKRGNPSLLFNVHLDTVPCGEGWSNHPLELQIEGDRAIGRGACDIKGAAAALVAAAQNSVSDFAILFSTDEEAGDSRCIKAFCESSHKNDYSMVVVAEPTQCKAVLEHRGFVSAEGNFNGVAGHSSRPELLAKSANHFAVRWCFEALQSIKSYETETLQGQSACFNLGRIDGGTKDNVTADHCKVAWSMRLPPMTDDTEIRCTLEELANHQARWDLTCSGPALPKSKAQLGNARKFAQGMGLTIGDPVDFWTEAALFSNSDLPAMVLGPGDIAQAHTTDEWVSLKQLEQSARIYQELAEKAHR